MNTIEQLQTVLKDAGLYGGDIDGGWGPLSQKAFDAAIHPSAAPAGDGWHNVLMSTFADPRDVIAYLRAKKQGMSDQQAFAVGDNGIGCWGDDTAHGPPMVAVPPEDMIERWGSTSAAKHKPIVVQANGKTVTVILGDSMPHRANIHNGCGLDANPATIAALGLSVPSETRAAWKWA